MQSRLSCGPSRQALAANTHRAWRRLPAGPHSARGLARVLIRRIHIKCLAGVQAQEHRRRVRGLSRRAAACGQQPGRGAPIEPTCSARGPALARRASRLRPAPSSSRSQQGLGASPGPSRSSQRHAGGGWWCWQCARSSSRGLRGWRRRCPASRCAAAAACRARALLLPPQPCMPCAGYSSLSVGLCTCGRLSHALPAASPTTAPPSRCVGCSGR